MLFQQIHPSLEVAPLEAILVDEKAFGKPFGYICADWSFMGPSGRIVFYHHSQSLCRLQTLYHPVSIKAC
jgi:hypothetical protein